MYQYLSLGEPLSKLFWLLGYVFTLGKFIIKYFNISLITQCSIGLTYYKSWEFLKFRERPLTPGF